MHVDVGLQVVINNDGLQSCEHKIYATSLYACPNKTEGVCTSPELADCESCVKQSGCGWCSLTQKCTRGTEIAPEDNDCIIEYWHTSANPCISACGALSHVTAKSTDLTVD